MTNTSFVHAQIVSNLVGALWNATVDGPYVVLSSSMKVRVPIRDGDVCPDVCVIRGVPEFVGDATDVLANPAVIVEVLSDATERFDRGKKFAGYLSLPSLVDYLLVATTRVGVEHYTRGDEGTWVLRDVGASARLRLPGIAAEIAIDDVYRHVSLPDQDLVGDSTRAR
jgi:Uma2 family endonuclease